MVPQLDNIIIQIVIVDQENYVFVINTTEKSLITETLKIAEINPLLYSKYKNKDVDCEFENSIIIELYD